MHPFAIIRPPTPCSQASLMHKIDAIVGRIEFVLRPIFPSVMTYTIVIHSFKSSFSIWSKKRKSPFWFITLSLYRNRFRKNFPLGMMNDMSWSLPTIDSSNFLFIIVQFSAHLMSSLSSIKILFAFSFVMNSFSCLVSMSHPKITWVSDRIPSARSFDWLKIGFQFTNLSSKLGRKTASKTSGTAWMARGIKPSTAKQIVMRSSMKTRIDHRSLGS